MLTFSSFAVFLQEVFIISHCKVGEICEVMFNLFDLCFKVFYLIVQLIDV